MELVNILGYVHMWYVSLFEARTVANKILVFSFFSLWPFFVKINK